MLSLAAALMLSASPAEQLAALDGFQGARWGMSLQEVRRALPRAQLGRDGWLTMDGPVAGFPARTVFFFGQGKLKGVAVTFGDAPGRTPESVFLAVGAALKGKYGADGMPDEPIERGAAWMGPRTRIGLRLERVPLRVVLTYRSQELAGLEDQVTPEQARDL